MLQNSNKEKLVAAKKRLKQFKKEKKQQNDEHSERSSSINGHYDSTNGANENDDEDEYLSNNEHLNSYYDKKYGKDMETYKEQLQVHLQTIGILVAEKTELQSTIQQMMKKIDKKQDECDELNGRLKQTRHKINELEKELNERNAQNSDVNSIKDEYNDYIQNISVDLNSKMLENDELKMRYNELNDKYNNLKLTDIKMLNEEINDLKSQLEMSNLKIIQLNALNNNVSAQEPESQSNIDNEAIIQDLNKKLTDLSEEYRVDKDNLKQSYTQYVENLQKQIENLVDTINRMTDERENAFEQIDMLNKRVTELKNENDTLIKTQSTQIQQTPQFLIDERKQQLECEVQYFKQQIEILLVENNHLNGLIVEKENEALKLKQELLQMSEEKQNHNKILEEMHNEKVSLSKAIKQNKELKEQLNELESAYIKLTNTNADLLNQLQSEQFINKQLNYSLNELKNNQYQVTMNGNNDTHQLCNHNYSHYELDNEEEEQKQQQKRLLSTSISVIEERIVENNNNKKDDWNDETDAETNFSDNQVNETTKSEHNEIINLLNIRIQKLESERNDLFEKLNEMKNERENFNPVDQANYKLLEQKFMRVMKDNADLKEKIQQLEHLIEQLQCETDTIIDYISLYQVEREKLAHKYRIKDDYIEKLNKKLELNRYYLNEFNQYLQNLFNTKDDDGDNIGALFNELNQFLRNLNDLNQDLILNTDEKKLKYDQLAANLDSANNGDIKLLDSIIVCSSCQGDYFVV